MNDEQLNAFFAAKAAEVEAFQRLPGGEDAKRNFLQLALEHVYYRGVNAGLQTAQEAVSKVRI